MGLIVGILTLPLAPVRGALWIAERVLDEVERELNDPAAIERQIVDAEAAYVRGDLSEAEFERIEADLLGRLLRARGRRG